MGGSDRGRRSRGGGLAESWASENAVERLDGPRRGADRVVKDALVCDKGVFFKVDDLREATVPGACFGVAKNKTRGADADARDPVAERSAGMVHRGGCHQQTSVRQHSVMRERNGVKVERLSVWRRQHPCFLVNDWLDARLRGEEEVMVHAGRSVNHFQNVGCQANVVPLRPRPSTSQILVRPVEIARNLRHKEKPRPVPLVQKDLERYPLRPARLLQPNPVRRVQQP
ncbi:hypothetical protein DFJ73DRAFT_814075 [Zopfochytrium polystomum]|nr:hypothetical protein DFJ73DRAFT_814075 [Zopfochytrium polystomum]